MLKIKQSCYLSYYLLELAKHQKFFLLIIKHENSFLTPGNQS